MKIGITLNIQETFSVWTQGSNQYVLFLSKLLAEANAGMEVYIINTGNPDIRVSSPLFSVPVIYVGSLPKDFSVIIEVDKIGDPKIIANQRARGCKVVSYVSNDPYYSGLVEPIIFDKTQYYPNPLIYDEIWVEPQHAKLYAVMLKTIHKAPVWECPFIWEPYLLEQRVKEIEAQGFGLSYGFKSDETFTKLKVAIFEPNVSVTKNSLFPMLIVNEVYRKEPEAIVKMDVLNTEHLKTHNTLLYFANSLEVVKDHKANFEGRHDTPGYMCQHANAVVSCGAAYEQSYMHLDVLYGNYPLIHNSKWLTAGYYYNAFDVDYAASNLLQAYRHHAESESLRLYKDASSKVFEEVSITKPSNVNGYVRKLLSLIRA